MSHRVRYMLVRNMRDLECIEKALDLLGANYVKSGKDYVLKNGTLINKGCCYRFEYIENESLPLGAIDIHSFVQKFTKTYEKVLDEKISKIRIEEANLKAKQIAEQFTEEEKRKEESKLKLERARLEEIKRKELEEKKLKIQEAEKKIRENAAKANFQVKEEMQGGKKVLVCVRRS